MELYFNDSMQTVYARGGGGGGSQQRVVADGADVVFTYTAYFTSSAVRAVRCFVTPSYFYRGKTYICGR